MEPPVPAVRPRSAVSARAIWLGAALIPVNCLWMAAMEMQWNSLDSTCVSLFFHVIFLLLALVVINGLVQRRAPRFALTQAEMMTVYLMLSIASAVMGRDSLENLPSVLAFMRWFDNPTNRLARFFDLVPRWMAPADKGALQGYYNGNASFWTSRHLSAWVGPLLFWCAFIVVLTWVMMCLTALLRRRWAEEEKLSFPTMQIPLSITTPGTFRDRTLWAGFLIPCIIQSMNSINYFIPSVPTLHLKLQDIGPYFASMPPWNALGWFPVGFFPFAIGLAFFLPLDLAFSCWAFYVLRKLIDVGCVAWGLRDPGASPSVARIPYVHEQGAGAWIGLSLALLWLSRTYLRDVLRQAIRGGEDPHAGMSYRTAAVGALAGIGLLSAACIAGGMSAWLPVIYFGFYFILSIGITRVRAELGPPAHELNWINPERLVIWMFGSQALGQQNLTLLTYMYWFNRGYRNHPMPHQLEGLKAGQILGMESRRLVGAMMLAAVLGAVFGLAALMDILYRTGEGTPKVMAYATGIGREAFGRLGDWVDNPKPPDGMSMGFIGVGAAVTLGLAIAKSRFVWWPFHPIGYALANSYALEYFWCAIFIGWLLKAIIVRYGGAPLYRKSLPFFLGLILGDYVIAALWSLAGWVMGVSTYRTFIF